MFGFKSKILYHHRQTLSITALQWSGCRTLRCSKRRWPRTRPTCPVSLAPWALCWMNSTKTSALLVCPLWLVLGLRSSSKPWMGLFWSIKHSTNLVHTLWSQYHTIPYHTIPYYTIPYPGVDLGGGGGGLMSTPFFQVHLSKTYLKTLRMMSPAFQISKFVWESLPPESPLILAPLVLRSPNPQ